MGARMSSSYGSLEVFRHEVAHIALLTPEQERDLARRYQGGDRRAGEHLVRAHLGFVLMIAREYRRWGVPMEDIVQQGNLGLLKGAQRFEPGRGFRLTTYAAYWIRAEIREYVMRAYRVVRLGTTKAERRAVRMYRQTGEAHPETLAMRSGLGVAHVERLLPLLTARESSLDQVGPSGRSPLDQLASPVPTPEDQAMHRDRTRKLRLEIRQFLRKLPARERFILRARWISESPQTLEELGARFGVSKERIRQLEARTLTQLRGRLLACRDLAEAC